MSDIIMVAVILILILFAGFFTSSETAYISLTKVKLRRMQEEGKRGAKTVAKLKSNMPRLLTTVLIGTNFLNSLASALATAFAIALLGSKGSGIAPFVTAFFITTFAQIVPKTAAALNPEKYCSRSAPILFILQKLIFPVVWLFERLSHIVVWFVEKIIKPQNAKVTQEELKTLIDVGENEGTIEKDERKMLNKIIEFNDLTVNDIMKHRSLLSSVSETASYIQVIREFEKSGFSTLTVYKDSKENVTGVINYKEILYGDEAEQKDFDKNAPEYAKKVKREVVFIPGTLSVLEVLQKFRTDQHKFAVVLNEQGETSGIVTMEQVDKSYNWISLDYKACANIYEDSDTSDLVAKAEAKYNRAMNDIKQKDNMYDLQLKNIDTEHTALQTEYESVKKVMEKNIDRTMKFDQSA